MSSSRPPNDNDTVRAVNREVRAKVSPSGGVFPAARRRVSRNAKERKKGRGSSTPAPKKLGDVEFGRSISSACSPRYAGGLDGRLEGFADFALGGAVLCTAAQIAEAVL